MIMHNGACATVAIGDTLTTLRGVADQTFNCAVTSPPYFGLRDYDMPGQMGLEATPDEYVAAMVTLFREVRRVLRNDGTLWLNLGDSYAGSGKGVWNVDDATKKAAGTPLSYRPRTDPVRADKMNAVPRADRNYGLAAKQLIGIPWRVAFALQADGWYLRQDIIWHKPNPMPESTRDRCTKAHEYIFMLSKAPKYYYDAAAIAEPLASASVTRLSQAGLDAQHGSDRVPGKPNGPMKAVAKQDGHGPRHKGFNARYYGSDQPYTGTATKNYAAGGAQDASATKARIVDRILAGEIVTRNKRDVWTVTTKPFSGAHFATFPPDLIEPCVLAGCPAGGIVLDPFGGSGTTGAVAVKHGRNAFLCELNPISAAMLPERFAACLKR